MPRKSPPLILHWQRQVNGELREDAALWTAR
jgi:hypothetical protein